jgi:acetyl-CoA acetyltransferase family protein
MAREFLAGEIMPIIGPRGPVLSEDENVRENQSIEALKKLRSLFGKQHGSVTAGNACPITDGAVSLLVASEDVAEEFPERLGKLIDFSYVGLDPTRMGLGPVHAIRELLRKTDLTLQDIDLFEINEAFSGQVLGCLAAAKSAAFAKKHWGDAQALGEISPVRLNVNGGAVALGHPVGATGARLVLTLLRELKRRGKKRGIAALCIGGGQGAALLLEV